MTRRQNRTLNASDFARQAQMRNALAAQGGAVQIERRRRLILGVMKSHLALPSAAKSAMDWCSVSL